MLEVYIFDAVRKDISLYYYSLFYFNDNKPRCYSRLSIFAFANEVSRINRELENRVQFLYKVPQHDKQDVIRLLEESLQKENVGFSDITALESSRERMVKEELKKRVSSK